MHSIRFMLFSKIGNKFYFKTDAVFLILTRSDWACLADLNY
jgi:hypothetical protein